MRKLFVFAALLLFVGIGNADAQLAEGMHREPYTSQSGVVISRGDIAKLMLPYRDCYVSVGTNYRESIKDPLNYIGAEYIVEGWHNHIGIAYVVAKQRGVRGRVFINVEAALMSKEVEFKKHSYVSYYK